jgi:hypothetical protein
MFFKLFYRQNVSYKNAEGSDWKEIDLPPNKKDILSCTCSSRGRLWCIHRDGSLIIRSGITKEAPYGSYWIKTLKPSIDISLQQMSISSDTVWALENQGSLYYHKGIVNNIDLKKFGTEWVKVPVNINIKTIANGHRVGFSFE